MCCLTIFNGCKGVLEYWEGGKNKLSSKDSCYLCLHFNQLSRSKLEVKMKYNEVDVVHMHCEGKINLRRPWAKNKVSKNNDEWNFAELYLPWRKFFLHLP